MVGDDLMPRTQRAEWATTDTGRMPTSRDCVLWHNPHVRESLAGELATDHELTNAFD